MALEWQQEVVARLQSGLKAQQATTPAEAEFKWFKDDPNEPREIVEARQNLAAQPRTLNIEVERTLRAIRSLKEETERTDLNHKPVVNEPLTIGRASAATKQ
jgi:hypothetical protein